MAVPHRPSSTPWALGKAIPTKKTCRFPKAIGYVCGGKVLIELFFLLPLFLSSSTDQQPTFNNAGGIKCRTTVLMFLFFLCSGLVDPVVVVEQSGRMPDANDGDGTFRSFLHRHPRRYVSNMLVLSMLLLSLTVFNKAANDGFWGTVHPCTHTFLLQLWWCFNFD